MTYLVNNDEDFIQTYLYHDVTYRTAVPLVKDSFNFDSNDMHNHGDVVIDHSTPKN